MTDNRNAFDAAIAAWNAGDLDRYLELYDEGIALHGYSEAPMGKAEVRGFYRGLFDALDDLHLDVVRVVEEGDVLAVHAVMSGTHTGDLFGVPATDDKMREDIYDAARKGFVPLVATGVDIDPALAVAAESWTYTVPEDLRQEATNQSLIGPPPRLTGGGRNDAGRNTNRNPKASQLLRRYTGGQGNRTPDSTSGPRVVTSISAERTINSGGSGGALLADGGSGN